MLEQFLIVTTALALLVGICRYIIGGALRISHPNVGIVKNYSYFPTISILLPCFMESKHVYETIQSIWQSSYPHNKMEVIAIDDGSSDDSYEWLKKAVLDFPHTRAGRNLKNQGKTHTIMNALAQSTAEIVIIVDSDTTLGVGCIAELMSCLGDPRLGAVGAPALVGNPNVNALTAFQVYLYTLGFQLGKTIVNGGR
jgi:cellulose synthase/poly-beta-1,6-N-acetylglucosamine synthase-like glycosyltransferase